MTNREKAANLAARFTDYLAGDDYIGPGEVRDMLADDIAAALTKSESDALERAAVECDLGADSLFGSPSADIASGTLRRQAEKIRALKPTKGTDVEK